MWCKFRGENRKQTPYSLKMKTWVYRTVGVGCFRVWKKDSGYRQTLGLLPSLGHVTSAALNMVFISYFLSKQILFFLLKLLWFIFFYIKTFLYIDFKRERERERFCCFTYLCTHWLVFVCALMWDKHSTLVHWDDAPTN